MFGRSFVERFAGFARPSVAGANEQPAALAGAYRNFIDLFRCELHHALGLELHELLLLRKRTRHDHDDEKCERDERDCSRSQNFAWSSPPPPHAAPSAMTASGSSTSDQQEDRFHLAARKQDHGGTGMRVATAVERSSRTSQRTADIAKSLLER
jgi:hypothetical protein